MRSIPDNRKSDLDRGARPARNCGSFRSLRSPPISGFRPRLCRTRSASPRLATSTPISPSSTLAIDWSRSGLSLNEAARARPGLLQDLRVPTSSGATTPLSAVADFSIAHGPTAINRYDRTRRVTIEGDLRGDAALGAAVAAIHALPTAKNLPAGRRNPRDRRRRGHERSVRLLRRRDGRGPHDGLRAPRAPVRQFPAADHDPNLVAALDRRRDHRAPHHAQGDVDAGRNRHSDADGHRHQERDHAGRLCSRGDRTRDATHAGFGGSGPQARPDRS